MSSLEYTSAAYFPFIHFYRDYASVGVQSGRHLSLGKPVTITFDDPRGRANPLYANPAVITDGADMGSGISFFRAADQPNSTPYHITIDLETPAVIREVTLSAHLVPGSDTAYRFMYHASLDGENWVTLVDGSNNFTPGFLIHKINDQNPYRYFRMTVLGLRNIVNNNAGANWADGIIELAVYGTPVTVY